MIWPCSNLFFLLLLHIFIQFQEWDTTYHILSHHCHQCSLESHHSGQKKIAALECSSSTRDSNRWLKLQRSGKRTKLMGLEYVLSWELSWQNLLQFLSSLPSVQSRVPSQRSEERMHWGLVHQNAPVPQKTTIGDSNFKGQVREQNKWSLNTFWVES